VPLDEHEREAMSRAVVVVVGDSVIVSSVPVAEILGVFVALVVGPSPPTTDGAWTEVPVQTPSGTPAPPPEATPPEATLPEATPPEATPPEAVPPETAPPEATAPDATPSLASTNACPCDAVDWRCWQEHADVCNSTSPTWTPTQPAAPMTAALTTAEDDELAEIAQTRAADEEPAPPAPWYRFDSWQRRGVLIGLPLGVSGCRRAWCEGFKVGGFGGFEVGYRFGIVAPVAGATIGGGRSGVSEDLRNAGWDPAESTMRWIDAGIGALVFPVRRGRFDPYFGARLGYSRYVQDLSYTGDDSSSGDSGATLSLSRGAVRLLVGLDIFVRPVFALGPRFEVGIPFGGKMCATGDIVGLPDDAECKKIRDLTGDTDTMVGLDPSDLPLFWSFSLVARFVLPPPPAPPPA
jgi:hypothetical protein